MSNKILAWYFSNEDKKLRYDDNRQIRVGRTHKVKGNIKLCKKGLHASVNILDALGFAPGNILWKVELSGTTVIGDDKIVASERKYLACINATEVLRKFARLCALDVIHLWDAPKIVIDYLKTGDESLRAAAWAAALDVRAARDAAWDAGRAAVRAAAWDAGWDGARAAARAARDAAWAAARAAARAARDAAWAAARDAQSIRLLSLVEEEFQKK